MPVLISFGQEHCHQIGEKSVNKDTLAKVHHRKHAFELFGNKFFTDYPIGALEDEDLMQSFPGGVVDFTNEEVEPKEQEKNDTDKHVNLAQMLELKRMFDKARECPSENTTIPNELFVLLQDIIQDTHEAIERRDVKLKIAKMACDKIMDLNKKDLKLMLGVAEKIWHEGRDSNDSSNWEESQSFQYVQSVIKDRELG